MVSTFFLFALLLEDILPSAQIKVFVQFKPALFPDSYEASPRLPFSHGFSEQVVQEPKLLQSRFERINA